MLKAANTPVHEWALYKFDTPQRIMAGHAGDEEVYFDCSECREEDAVIHGFVGVGPEREDVAIVSKPDGTDPRPAYLCEACFHKALARGE